ncbi:MAG: metalloprotease family protein [Candidatus Pacebacteria bacterium]|nr:metalloprotease family protein [Candidatus Paceibacterota bacterium]
MFLIPNWLVSIITFPGVIIHEFAHKIFCNITGVHVQKVRYWRLGNPAGYVIHDEPTHLYQTFFISIGPLIVNSLVAIGPAYLSLHIQTNNIDRIVLVWIAFAAGACAFPSDADARNVLKKGGIILFPFFGLVWLANKLRYFYFDFLYSILLILVGFSFK